MNSLLSKLKKKSALSNTVQKVTYLAMHKIYIFAVHRALMCRKQA